MSKEGMEWCIALENIGPYMNILLGPRFMFLKGERATKEKVFNYIPEMTEEDYNKYFRPATEEEINGEFEWNGEQFILKGSKRMRSVREKSEEYGLQYPVIHYDKDGNTYDDVYKPSMDFEAGAEYVLGAIEKECKRIAQLCKNHVENPIDEEDKVDSWARLDEMEYMFKFIEQLKK